MRSPDIKRWMFPSTVALMLGLLILSCSRHEEDDRAQLTLKAVEGTIRGANVELVNSEFDGDLAIFQGDGWGFSPSLLIFLFLDEGEIPEGREYTISGSEELSIGNPHIHYRWWNPETKELDCDVAMDDYQMHLVFGEVSKGELPGTIEFSIPGDGTRLRGGFRARLKI